MAPPKKTQEELHRLAAQLYLEHKVDTTTSQGQLLEQMAARSAQRYGLNKDSERDRLRKAMQRAFTSTTRVTQLWSGVAARCAHPEGHMQHLGLQPEQSREVLTRMQAELTAGDPVLADVNALLEAARGAAPGDKAAFLEKAAARLLKLQPMAPADVTALSEAERTTLAIAAARVQRGWGAVFDAALGEGRGVPKDLLAVAEKAVLGGFAADRLERSLRRGLVFGRRGWQTPRSVVSYLGNPWIAAVAVLLVLRGIAADVLVERTAEWAAEHLGVPAESVSAGEVLTQAAATLMEAGQRGPAQQALAQLWETGDTHHVWEAALDMAITLAAQAYSHGEPEVAAAILDGPVRDELDGEYPGDPDEGWGACVDYGMYRLLSQALEDPQLAVGRLREQWAAEVGRDAFMPRAWWLTGMLVQALQQINEPRQAATVAALAPRAVEATRTPAVRALLGRLSEMTSSDAPGPDPANSDRIAALASELLALTLKDPKAADFAERRILEGVVRTMRLASREPRIRAR